jgi:alpha-tubulin suppressor-like RCC1 family protein
MRSLIHILFLLLLITRLTYAQMIGTGHGYHSIAVKSNGIVYTWGKNDYEQLGDGSNMSSNVPVEVYRGGVLSDKTITQVATGYYHSIALASDGTVYTWGGNNSGQLGNGSNTNSNVPVAVTISGKTITQVAAGFEHSIALASDGTMYTWGYNDFGQLGNGSNTSSNVPVEVTISGKIITQVAAGGYHSIALASDGTLYTWGYNAFGQLGDGSTTSSNVPVAVTISGKTITQVAAGIYHSIVLASDGAVYTWGNNYYGQLGNNSNTDSNVPVAVYTSGVLSDKTITQVAAGYYHSIALASNGAVYTWGYNDSGQLGDGSNTSSNVPVEVYTSGVLSGKTITQVAVGFNHCIALASDGAVYTWGDNSYGQLGDGSTTNSNVPVAVDLSLMGPLPVELTTFAAQLNSQGVQLNWSTATEVNNYGFEVERKSLSGKNSVQWEKIGFVKGNGNSNSPRAYQFIDKNPLGGKTKYRLKQIDIDGSYSYLEEVEVNVELPKVFALEQNYPNPFNPTTTITFTLAEDGLTTFKIYDVLGREIKTLVNEVLKAGEIHRINFDGSGLSSGVYFYRLESNNKSLMRKFILMK